MAAPKTVKTLGGSVPTAADTKALSVAPPSPPMDPASLAVAVLQLQNTLNALIAAFNAHTHSGVTVGAGVSGAPSATYAGATVGATNAFTTS